MKPLNLITRSWREITPAEREDALSWYPRAHEYCWRLAKRYSVSLEVSVGVLAWLSPAVPWEQNKRDTDGLLADPFYKPTTYSPNVTHALEVINTGIVTFPKTAPKVSAFYACILQPEQDSRVCIDRWIARVHSIERLTPAKYAWLECAYLTAARRLDQPPAAVQAHVWIRARENWEQKSINWETN